MRKRRVLIAAAVGAAAFEVAFAPSARAAGCAFPDQHSGVYRQHQPWAQAGAYRPVSFVLASDSKGDEDATIVGFWHVTFKSEGSLYIPDDTVVDSAYVQWHSDGTEIMNSSRPPATSSFCLGVWKQTGPFTYRLNHVALSWNPDGTPVGPASIREEVTLNRRGNGYTGTFTIVQYDLSGTNVLPPTPIVGVLTGERITPD